MPNFVYATTTGNTCAESEKCIIQLSSIYIYTALVISGHIMLCGRQIYVKCHRYTCVTSQNKIICKCYQHVINNFITTVYYFNNLLSYLNYSNKTIHFSLSTLLTFRLPSSLDIGLTVEITGNLLV